MAHLNHMQGKLAEVAARKLREKIASRMEAYNSKHGIPEYWKVDDSGRVVLGTDAESDMRHEVKESDLDWKVVHPLSSFLLKRKAATLRLIAELFPHLSSNRN